MTENSLFEEEQTEEVNWLEENAVKIAIVFANLLVVLGEWRVFDFVRRVTGSLFMAILALFTVGLPFLLYELFWKQPNANEKQRSIALSLGVFTLIVTGAIGVMDYVFIGVQVSERSESFALGAIALMLSIHTVAILRYAYLDDAIRARWHEAAAQRKLQRDIDNLKRAQTLLDNRKKFVDNKAELEKTYSGDVDKQLAQLQGKKVKPEASEKINPTNRQQS